ncbi:MAG: Dickkopf N-terminal cysteine-rich domain-containing protein [Polyangiales bacterium]
MYPQVDMRGSMRFSFSLFAVLSFGVFAIGCGGGGGGNTGGAGTSSTGGTSGSGGTVIIVTGGTSGAGGTSGTSGTGATGGTAGASGTSGTGGTAGTGGTGTLTCMNNPFCPCPNPDSTFCSSNADCASRETCMKHPCADVKVCVASGNLCVVDEDCHPNSYCNKSDPNWETCAPKAGTPGECNDSRDCLYGYACEMVAGNKACVDRGLFNNRLPEGCPNGYVAASVSPSTNCTHAYRPCESEAILKSSRRAMR